MSVHTIMNYANMDNSARKIDASYGLEWPELKACSTLLWHSLGQITYQFSETMTKHSQQWTGTKLRSICHALSQMKHFSKITRKKTSETTHYKKSLARKCSRQFKESALLTLTATSISATVRVSTLSAGDFCRWWPKKKHSGYSRVLSRIYCLLTTFNRCLVHVLTRKSSKAFFKKSSQTWLRTSKNVVTWLETLSHNGLLRYLPTALILISFCVCGIYFSSKVIKYFSGFRSQFSTC